MRITSACPRGARMALQDYNDIDAVRCRGWGLVSTSFSKRALCFLGQTGNDLAACIRCLLLGGTGIPA